MTAAPLPESIPLNDTHRTARAMAAAQERALSWPDQILVHVKDLMPPVYARVSLDNWVTTVAWAQRDDETPEQAATRLRWYVDLYVERNGVTPAMGALRTTTEPGA